MLSLASISACDNTVDPFADGGGRQFAVSGYLDMSADTQFVRISRVRHDEALNGGVADPPLVATTNLDTGESVAWTDSVVVLDDGSRGLIFFVPLEVQAGNTYRMDVRDRVAATTRATTTVPSTAGVAAGMPRRAGSGDLVQTLIWEDLRRGREAQVHYRVNSLPTGTDTTIVLSYAGSGQISARGWAIGVMLDRDYRLVRRFVENARGDTAVVLVDISMSIEALSPEWAVTGEATNIENGSGFFASVGRFRESWSLDSTIIRSIGFRVP